jgi:spermidine synthase
MSQHDLPERVLLISGGVSGTVDELLKYGVAVDYVELDPLIIELGSEFTDLSKVNVFNKDARLFVKGTDTKYDVVIIDLPDPGTAQLNRFYTLEFFEELKQTLKDDAVISTSLLSTENYLTNEAKRLNSVLFNTISEVFDNVIILPLGKNYFLASDKELSYEIESKVPTIYVNDNYLKGELTEDRIQYQKDSIIKTKINRDFEPVTNYYHLLFWMSYFKENYLTFMMIIGFLTILFLFTLRSISFGIFTSGFAASSLEVIILIGFQIVYGYVYHMIGLVITVFMLGLTVGSFTANKLIKRLNVLTMVRIEFLMAIFAVLVPLIMMHAPYLFLLLTFIISFLVGMEFPVASKVSFKTTSKTAAKLYTADLVGAALGAFLVSALLIPLVGIINVCLIIALLNLISGFVVWSRG